MEMIRLDMRLMDVEMFYEQMVYLYHTVETNYGCSWRLVSAVFVFILNSQGQITSELRNSIQKKRLASITLSFIICKSLLEAAIRVHEGGL